MRFQEWFSERGPFYIRQRARNLLDRYRISPSRAIQRIEACLEGLANLGCAPTLPTPGIVVKRYPQFFRRLQQAGAEIAVHGYQHVDYKTYSATKSVKQLVKAVETFKRYVIENHGFRCPYLGWTDELLDVLPKGLFEYSSNKAIYWDALQDIDNSNARIIFDTLRKLYRVKSSTNAISVPYTRPNMLEIPVSLPDDMELLDGLSFSAEDIVNAWSQILVCTHQRGELFNLIFHPELADICEQPFYEVFSRAKLLQPRVWVARLCDISDWWAEKAGFSAEVTPSLTGLRLDFVCSLRAIILVKGFNLNNSGCDWDGQYQRLLSRTLEIPASPRPFIGLSPKTPQKVIAFLMEQGYILDTTERAYGCGIYLDEASLVAISSEVQLVDYIESSTSPLVRYWRWPDGAKSAMSITGDLDALSLLDYLSRLY